MFQLLKSTAKHFAYLWRDVEKKDIFFLKDDSAAGLVVHLLHFHFMTKHFVFSPGPAHTSEGAPYTAETNGFHDNWPTEIQDDRLED